MPSRPGLPSPSTPRPSRRSRRWLALAVLATLLVVVVDLGGWGWPSRLHSAGAAVFGPVLRWVGPSGDDELSRARAANVRLADELRQARESATATSRLSPLLASPDLQGASVVAARVVAVGSPGASGPERVTLDVGRRDGIEVDQPVVAVDGLVGRVVDVSSWTSDVLLLGAADLRVGVRSGSMGVLGMVGAASSGAASRTGGELTLTVVAGGSVAAGDALVTLGSPGGRPFVAGIPVGTVARVDDPGGTAARTAAVRPAVDVTELDVVGVLRTVPRTTPRPASTP